jgi:hypothetical protein
MSWLSDLITRNDPKSFEQDLELLVARWMDRSRKGVNTLGRNEIADSLRAKAQELSPEPPRPKPTGRKG